MQQENPKMYSSVSNQFTVSPHPHSPLSVSCCKPMVETVKIKVLSVIIVILLINCAIILTNWSGEHRELRDNIGQLGVQCSMQPLLLLFISNTLTFHRHYYCQFNIMPQLPHCRHWPTSLPDLLHVWEEGLTSVIWSLNQRNTTAIRNAYNVNKWCENLNVNLNTAYLAQWSHECMAGSQLSWILSHHWRLVSWSALPLLIQNPAHYRQPPHRLQLHWSRLRYRE